ncbi:MAG: outer membrane beta-barrel protein [Xanthobacteraceae bacterium]
MPPRLRLFVSILLAVATWAVAMTMALAQNTGTLDLPSSSDVRLAQRFDPARLATSSSNRFVPANNDQNDVPFPQTSGASTTGFDSTNARRRRTPARAATRPPVLSAAQSATARAIAREAQQRYRYDVVPQEPSVGPVTAAPVIIPVHRRPPTVIDPFAPLGVRAGAFVLFPSVELSGGYDSNPLRLRSGEPSAGTLSVTPELLVRSDWQRHALNADIRGNYLWYSRTFEDVTTATSSPSLGTTGVPRSLDRPSLESKVNGRLDVIGKSHADVEGRFTVGTDNPGSPNVAADLARLPIYTRVGGSLGYTQNFNRVDLTVKGGLDRISYQDSRLTDGTTSPNDDRDYQQYALSLRGSYELTPGVRPFVEVAGDERRHDLFVDRNGIRRDSDMITARAGSTFELSRIVTGEASAGYLSRKYKDPTLPEVSGLVADASLIWLPSALTTVTLTAKSASDESIVAAVSGALRRDFTVQVDHAFRLWLIGTFRGGVGFDTYASTGTSRDDERFFLSAALVYKLTREMQVKAEVRRDWLKSNIDSADYAANVALIGIRWQR